MSDLLSDLRHRMHVRQLPGLSIRLAHNAHPLFNHELGVSDLTSGIPLASTHLFRVACLTKPVVAHAILLLAARGRLGLDDPIGAYIPQLRTRPEIHAITIGQLASHTAGLARGPYHARACADDEVLQQIIGSHLLFTPGERFKYSNWGYCLLGRIIECASGVTLETFILQEIFCPFKMRHSVFSGNADSAPEKLATGYWKGWYFGAPDLSTPSIPCPHTPLPESAGGILSTADDYLRWLLGFSKMDRTGGAIDVKVVESMLASRHWVSQNYSVCLGLFKKTIDGVPFYYCSGSNSGFSGFMFLMPDIDLCGVAFANHGSCNHELRDILYRVCQKKIDGCSLPRFGRRAPWLKVVAANRKSIVHFSRAEGKTPECTHDERQLKLYPHSDYSYFVLNSRYHQMLRLKTRAKDDTTVTIGDQVFHEKLLRLKEKRADHSPWANLAGFYRHEAFGMVEVICRESRIFLSYGAAYEVVLQPIGGLRFRQKPGAFCFEIVMFNKESDGENIASLAMSYMIFFRQSPSFNHKHHDESTLHYGSPAELMASRR